MLFIPGDLFDRLLHLTDTFLPDILNFFSRVIDVSEKHDIIVRILEGTPGHDWKQSDLMMSLVSAMSKKIDIKHVTTLSIEHIDRYNIDILYVPDEWNIDVTQTYDEVLQLLRDRNLQQVDFCLFHGAFNYQIDERLNPKAHSEELWSRLVRYYIFAGHVHIRSQYKNILVAGSFDRLAHGEEHDKGWLTLTILPDDTHQIVFRENPYATWYKTINVSGLTVDEAIEKIDTIVSDYPDYSHVRLVVTERDAIKDGLKTLKLRHPKLHFRFKVENKEREQKRTLKLVEAHTEVIELNVDNIGRVLEERLNQLSGVDTQKVLNYFNRFI